MNSLREAKQFIMGSIPQGSWRGGGKVTTQWLFLIWISVI